MRTRALATFSVRQVTRPTGGWRRCGRRQSGRASFSRRRRDGRVRENPASARIHRRWGARTTRRSSLRSSIEVKGRPLCRPGIAIRPTATWLHRRRVRVRRECRRTTATMVERRSGRGAGAVESENRIRWARRLPSHVRRRRHNCWCRGRCRRCDWRWRTWKIRED